jgi:hypothetical protein
LTGYRWRDVTAPTFMAGMVARADQPSDARAWRTQIAAEYGADER